MDRGRQGTPRARWRFFATALTASTLASWFAIAGGVIEARADSPYTEVAPYNNPFRGVQNLAPKRIDQGVDYFGDGSVYPIGDGIVTNVYNAGWPNGVFISYRLTKGQATGYVVYIAECIWPIGPLHKDYVVHSDTAIGTMRSCWDPNFPQYCGTSNTNCGIETGWADPNHPSQPLASGGYGGQSSSYGLNFSDFLVALGALPGATHTSPYDTLPAGWPNKGGGGQGQCSNTSGKQYTQLGPSATQSVLIPYAGTEILTVSLQRWVDTSNWTWCFQTYANLRWGPGWTPPPGNFDLNVRVDCNGSPEAMGWAFDHSYTTADQYVNTGWWTASGPCNSYWGADDAAGSYGAQIKDQFGNTWNYGIPSHATYVSYGTM
jgi:hypothetical protein